MRRSAKSALTIRNMPAAAIPFRQTRCYGEREDPMLPIGNMPAHGKLACPSLALIGWRARRLRRGGAGPSRGGKPRVEDLRLDLGVGRKALRRRVGEQAGEQLPRLGLVLETWEVDGADPSSSSTRCCFSTEAGIAYGIPTSPCRATEGRRGCFRRVRLQLCFSIRGTCGPRVGRQRS